MSELRPALYSRSEPCYRRMPYYIPLFVHIVLSITYRSLSVRSGELESSNANSRVIMFISCPFSLSTYVYVYTYIFMDCLSKSPDRRATLVHHCAISTVYLSTHATRHDDLFCGVYVYACQEARPASGERIWVRFSQNHPLHHSLAISLSVKPPPSFAASGL